MFHGNKDVFIVSKHQMRKLMDASEKSGHVKVKINKMEVTNEYLY